MFKRFPTFRNKNVALYYLLTIFMNGWFILPNWVFYYAQFVTIPQIGLIDGLSKVVAVFLEVPSGAISDLMGKKRTLIAGNLFFFLSCLIILFAHNFVGLLIGNIFMFVGFAFVSGSKEALLYDSLIDIKKEDFYDEVLGKVNSLAMFATIASIFIGGLLYHFEPRLTFIAWMVCIVAAITVLLCMTEPHSDEQHVTYGAYFSKLQTGVSSIFTQPIFAFVVPVLFFSMLFRSYEGVIRQNTGAYFGFTGETFGYMLALISIPTLFVSYNYNQIVKRCNGHIEIVFSVLYAIGFFIVFVSKNMYLGILSFLLVYIAQEMAKPYTVSLVNKKTESKHRATALSTVSLFSEVPYMVTTIFLGAMLELENIPYLYSVYFFSMIAYIFMRLVNNRFSDVITPKTQMKEPKDELF